MLLFRNGSRQKLLLVVIITNYGQKLQYAVKQLLKVNQFLLIYSYFTFDFLFELTFFSANSVSLV